jgi:hypothetical protein
MAGVRIQHPTARDTTFTIVDGARPYRVPLTCSPWIVVHGERRPCARIHPFKTYHLALDSTGATVVSAGVLERLKAIPGNPFVIANEVRRPPDQRVLVPLIRLFPRPSRPGV